MNTNDLFNNPMVQAAKNAMTPEQLENYKKIGEYMYNNDTYKIAQVGSKVNTANTEELILYATSSLKSGGDPADLTDEELRALINTYGDKWFERFGIEEHETRKPAVQLVTQADALEEIKNQAKKFNHSRQERRAMERKMKKKLR